MMRWLSKYFQMLIITIILCFSMLVNASTITAYLDLVLAEDGVLIDGNHDVTLQLYGPTGDLRWTETHEEVVFFQGVCSFEFGTLTDIETIWFYDSGVQFFVLVNNSTVEIPLWSTPFSMYAHAADLVNSIQMEGVFHTDLVNERVGINIDIPTPSVRLEVNGAVRVGDSDHEEKGTIRWRDYRLQGLHNDGWKLLDVSEDDGFDSKWTLNGEATAIYVNDRSVVINTENVIELLTVDGDVDIEGAVNLTGELVVSDSLMINEQYGVTLNGNLIISSLTIDDSNVMNFTDGLKISGVFSGNGGGIYNIDNSNLKDDGIQGYEIGDQVIFTDHIQLGVIENRIFQNEAITRADLTASFELTNDYFLDQIVSDNHFEKTTFMVSDLSDDFEFMPYHFEDDSLLSVNIEAREIDGNKINDSELLSGDFKDAFIEMSTTLAINSIFENHILDNTIVNADFESATLLYDHFQDPISFELGGTNQNSFGDAGELIYVSSDKLSSEPSIVLNDFGLGINVSNHTDRLHILQDEDGIIPLHVSSNDSSSSNLLIQNDDGQWLLTLGHDENFYIKNTITDKQMLTIDQSGKMGVGGDSQTELITVHGGFHIGDVTIASESSEGTMYFDEVEEAFKLITSYGVHTIDSTTTDLANNYGASYLYAKNVQNESFGSRVLLSNQIGLYGSQHIVTGANQSMLYGHRNRVSQFYSSLIDGDSNYGDFVGQQVVFGSSNHIDFGTNGSIIGDSNTISQFLNSFIVGEKNSISVGKNIHVFGDSNQGAFVSNNHIYGEDNILEHIHDSVIDGSDNSITLMDSVQLNGLDNNLSLIKSSVLLGNDMIVNQSDDATIQGTDHFVFGLNGGSVFGDNHFIFQGDGTYIGKNNIHIGSGQPTVIGEEVMIIGHQNHIVNGDHLISLGASSHELDQSMSDAIILHAPGGVSIVSSNYVISYLAPNGGSWAHVSDESLKTNIQLVDHDLVLNKIMDLPISHWNYKGQLYIQHIGPMAQDFFELFQFGSDSRYIQSVDMDGVILSGIKALGGRSLKLFKRSDEVGLTFQELNEQIKLVESNYMHLHELDSNLQDLEIRLNQEMSDLHKKEISQTKVIHRLSDRLSRYIKSEGTAKR